MADNIVAGLFGLTPFQVEQQQRSQIGQQADTWAAQDPFQRANAGMYRAGAGLAGIGAGMLGMVNPQVQEAERTQTIMGKGGDLTTSAGLKAKAQQFAAVGDQKTAMQLVMLARQKEAEEQKMMLEQRKAELGERKQAFQEDEMHDLRKMEAEARIRQNDERIRDARTSAADRSALMRENNQIKLLIAEIGQAGKASGAKPPSGYRYTADGNLEPIPGGPKDMTGKNKAISESAEMKAKLVTQKVDEALGETGFFSTGLTGEVLGMIPGTGAYDLEATLDTIKANLGFNELQAMRQASPTGGALGQVAVRELEMLQATIASLKKGQSQAKLRNSLEQVKLHYGNWKKAVEQANTEEVQTPKAGGVTFKGWK